MTPVSPFIHLLPACSTLVRTACLMILMTSHGAFAAATNWVTAPEASIRLIADHKSVAAGATFWAALQIAPSPTWKTYWRSPGEAGSGPVITWGPETAADVGDLQYPWPEVFESAGFTSIGYQSDVTLPFQVQAPATGNGLTLAGTVYYQVCQDICVPLEANLSLTLPIGTPVGAPEAQHIKIALMDVPQRYETTQFNAKSWVEGRTVVLQLTHDEPLSQVAALMEGIYGIAAAADQLHLSEDRQGARFIFNFGSRANRLRNKSVQVVFSQGLIRHEFPVRVQAAP